MYKETTWTIESKGTVNKIKRLSGYLASSVREEQFEIFKRLLKPNKFSRIADVGVASQEDIKGVNQFEKLYEYPKKLTLLTIENSKQLKHIYPQSQVKQIKAGRRLPYKDKNFDIVVSWATLEHVGGYKNQEDFINELIRVGKKIFITTPYRGALYEPHSGFFFLHWLPLHWFRTICKLTKNEFWSKESNLNPLLLSDLKKMKFKKRVKLNIYKTFHLLPSHIIITI